MTEDATESTDLIVFPRAETQFRDFSREVGELTAQSVHLTVTDKAESKVATDHLGALKDRRVAVEAFKKELLAPSKQRTGDINEAMGELLDPLTNADKFVKGMILAFNEAEREKVRQAEEIERRTQELADLKGEEAPKPAPLPAQPQAVTRGEHTNSNERQITKWELETFADVDDQWKTLDVGKVGRAVKAGGMSLTIKGIRIYQERILASG